MADSRLLIHPIRDVTVVTVNDSSVLDTLQVQQVGDELYNLVDNKAVRKMVLDFGKVQFLSSSALGVLITLRKKAEAIKARIIICGMRPELMKVFKITRLDKMFEFKDTEEQALSVFGVSTAG